MKIGITARFFYEDGKRKQGVNQTYLDVLKRYGAQPILLFAETDNRDLMDRCDGFLITGGGDLNPLLFGGDNLSENVHDALDQLDFTVLDYCVKKKKPCLGICRGIQSINVFFGGTLYQTGYEHHRRKHDCFCRISNKRGIFSKLKDEELKINSFHHQGIECLSPRLMKIGESDGVIEAVKHKELPIYGVQWHPELIDGPGGKEIFDSFFELLQEGEE